MESHKDIVRLLGGAKAVGRPVRTNADLDDAIQAGLPRAALEPDYTKEETDNANRVLDTIKDDLIACYKKRLRMNPDAHGFITVDVLVGPDGTVMKTDTTGGALLGKDTMQCIVRRMEKATFQKPHGGGTLHIRMPFSLRKIGPEDDDSI